MSNKNSIINNDYNQTIIEDNNSNYNNILNFKASHIDDKLNFFSNLNSNLSDNYNCGKYNKCRICLSSSSLDYNPLISPCKCTGSIKYIHVECLKKSIDSTLSTKIINNTYYYFYSKGLCCEICLKKYPTIVKFKNKNTFHLVDINVKCKNYVNFEYTYYCDIKDMYIFKGYIIMDIDENYQFINKNILFNSFDLSNTYCQCNFYYQYTNNDIFNTDLIKCKLSDTLLNNNFKIFKIGREPTNNIILNDSTVSRNHLILIVDIKNNMFYIIPELSKFGTYIHLLNDSIIINNNYYNDNKNNKNNFKMNQMLKNKYNIELCQSITINIGKYLISLKTTYPVIQKVKDFIKNNFMIFNLNNTYNTINKIFKSKTNNSYSKDDSEYILEVFNLNKVNLKYKYNTNTSDNNSISNYTLTPNNIIINELSDL